MKLMTMMATVAAIFVFSQSAQAREYHVRHRARHHLAREQQERPAGGMFGYSSYAAQTSNRGGAGGRPSAWCGWQMRLLVSADPGPQYKLARNWSRWGRSGPPGVGAVVVWSHHVGKIVGQQGGEWIVESGNDGHALRTRARSLAGVIAIRWG
jgi:hypothetical protein